MPDVSAPDPLRLAPTIAPLGGDPRRAIDRVAMLGLRAVQLSAGQAGTRPRELDRSARRDLRATLARRELDLAGLDAWIPPAHLDDRAHADRAVAALRATVELAGDLGRVPVSVLLPREPGPLARQAIDDVLAAAQRADVPLADHAVPPADDPALAVGLDPAAWLAAGDDPAEAASRLAGRLATARLSDLLASGLRGPVGDPAEGRLDVLAYRVALSVGGYARPVVADLRQWPDALDGLQRTRAAWDATRA